MTRGFPITRRGALRLLGLGASGALLAACGQAAAPTPAAAPPKPADKPAAAAPTTAPAAAAPAAAGQVKLSLWWFDRATINAMTKDVLKSEFMAKNTNIVVEEQLIPGGQMLTKLNASIQAKAPPDVIYIDETYLPDLFSQKALHPIPKDVFDVEKEMGPFTAFHMKLPDDKFYALPMGWFARSLFYNADLLKQSGFAAKDIPTKWDDLIRQNPGWSGGRIPVPVSIPDAYKV